MGGLVPFNELASVACDYKIQIRHSEMGYVDSQGGNPGAWKASAERLLRFEKGIGNVDFNDLPRRVLP